MTHDETREFRVVRPIGFVVSPYVTESGTPIQPTAPGAKPMDLRISVEYREGLTDLDGFERIWILAWLHCAKSAKLKVVPYRDSQEHGLFATRAPSRPNPIGISCANVESMDINTGLIRLAACDLLDGTPVLDIKPYVPEYDSFPGSRAGWLTDCPRLDTAVNRFSETND